MRPNYNTAPICAVLSRLVPLVLLLFMGVTQAAELDDINQLADQGKTTQALERLNTYLQAQPKDAKALFLKGVLLAETEKRDEAIKVFTDLTEKYPHLPAPYNNLAVLYAYQGNYDKARSALEAAIRTHPSYATAHENLGDIYARMASEAYGRALQLDTSNTRAKSKLALIKDLLPPPGQAANNQAALTAAPAPSPQVTAKAEARPASKPAETSKVVEASKSVDANKPAETKPAETAAAKVAEATPKDSVKDSAKPKASEATVAAPSANEQAVRDAVSHWSQAWASQNVEQYLSSYAKDFKTPNGESRSSWESTRRDRVSKPARIEVTLSNVQVQLENEHQAKVRFTQFYHAGSLSQRTSKQLIMVQHQGRWLIQQELANR